MPETSHPAVLRLGASTHAGGSTSAWRHDSSTIKAISASKRWSPVVWRCRNELVETQRSNAAEVVKKGQALAKRSSLTRASRATLSAISAALRR